MYYEEKLIDGVWHCRTNPNEVFRPMSSNQLHRKIADLQPTKTSADQERAIENKVRIIDYYNVVNNMMESEYEDDLRDALYQIREALLNAEQKYRQFLAKA